MKLAEFIQSEIATTNTTIFDSGWCKTEQVAKATGSSEVKVTSKLFNASQEGLPKSLAQWLKDGTVTIKQ